MEMHQIRYFLTLCEELNFTRAAEKCHVAQPALTRAIKLLEEEFGGLLFHRGRARTHLSELGQAVRPYLEEVQRQSQQAKNLATSLIELKSTPLKLGVMCTIGPGNFVGLLSNLQAQHPGIELQIMDARPPTCRRACSTAGWKPQSIAGPIRSTIASTISRCFASSSSSCSVSGIGWPRTTQCGSPISTASATSIGSIVSR
jgi:hypothetical protein